MTPVLDFHACSFNVVQSSKVRPSSFRVELTELRVAGRVVLGPNRLCGFLLQFLFDLDGCFGIRVAII